MSTVIPAPVPPITALDLLNAATAHIDEVAHDNQPRPMRCAVVAFNALTGRNLGESEAWLLLSLHRTVRDRMKPKGQRDSMDDVIAFASMYAEARLRE